MTCNCTHHCETRKFFYDSLKERDPEIARLIQNELWRQQDHIELIASENIVSEAVLQAQGSVLTNKYAEGYSGHRYYHGCEFIDGVETLLKELKSCLTVLLQMFNRIPAVKQIKPFIWLCCNPAIPLWV